MLAANLMAMVVQTLSAKLGIATGRNLAEVCRDNFPRRVSFGLWLQAEVIAMATDLAEVLGAALGLSLLFGIPLGWGAVIAVAAAFAILALQASGFRRLEAVIAVFVGVIVVAFSFELLARHAGPERDGRPPLLAEVRGRGAADRGRDRRRDGHGVSRHTEQWTVRASRRLAPSPELTAVGPIIYEILDPLRRVRIALAPSDVEPISFDIEIESDVPPGVEGPRDSREPQPLPARRRRGALPPERRRPAAGSPSRVIASGRRHDVGRYA